MTKQEEERIMKQMQQKIIEEYYSENGERFNDVMKKIFSGNIKYGGNKMTKEEVFKEHIEKNIIGTAESCELNCPFLDNGPRCRLLNLILPPGAETPIRNNLCKVLCGIDEFYEKQGMENPFIKAVRENEAANSGNKFVELAEKIKESKKKKVVKDAK